MSLGETIFLAVIFIAAVVYLYRKLKPGSCNCGSNKCGKDGLNKT